MVLCFSHRKVQYHYIAFIAFVSLHKVMGIRDVNLNTTFKALTTVIEL